MVVRPDKAAEGGLLDEEWVAMEPPKLEDMLPEPYCNSYFRWFSTPDCSPLILPIIPYYQHKREQGSNDFILEFIFYEERDEFYFCSFGEHF